MTAWPVQNNPVKGRDQVIFNCIVTYLKHRSSVFRNSFVYDQRMQKWPQREARLHHATTGQLLHYMVSRVQHIVFQQRHKLTRGKPNTTGN